MIEPNFWIEKVCKDELLTQLSGRSKNYKIQATKPISKTGGGGHIQVIRICPRDPGTNRIVCYI